MGLFRRGEPEQRAITSMSWWGTGADTPLSTTYSAELAMSLSAVRACVRFKSAILSQLPFDSYRQRGGGSELVTPSPLLIARPSGVVARTVWLSQLSASLDLWGNAYGAIVARDGAGYPTQVEWLPPDSVQVLEPVMGARPSFIVAGVPRDYGDVLHLAENVPPGSAKGRAPLERDGLVDLNRKAQEFGRNWFNNGAIPSMVLEVDRVIDDKVAAEIKQGWISKVGRHREPAVIGKGIQAKPLAVAANESQFLETIRHVQVDICMSFGLLPESIGIATSGQNVTYANREQRWQDVLVSTINPRLVLVQEILTAIVPRPQYVRFNTAALLRSDVKTRYEAYEIARRIGLESQNEQRAHEDLPPVPGGDDYTPLGKPTAPAPQEVPPNAEP
jgi:HK97 family phage portal protein